MPINTMKSRWINNLILLLIATLLGLGFCEVVARIITKTNEDGQAYYGKRPLLPYHFPAEMVRRKMEHYFNRQSEAYVIDDPLLGWTIGPNRSNVEGMYLSNSAGIRSRPNEYPLSPPEGVLRIELFGDSFTHGDEEPFDETWGKFLEDDLIKAGIATEVLNFGVPGYGVGQAYLRWKFMGLKYSPKIVVFGFQPENIKRTVNIFRSLYSRNTWLVFSKPRFFINDKEELELLNSPVIPPEEVGDIIENRGAYEIINLRNDSSDPDREYYSRTSMVFDCNNRIVFNYPVIIRSKTTIYGGKLSGNIHLDVFTKHENATCEEDVINELKQRYNFVDL